MATSKSHVSPYISEFNIISEKIQDYMLCVEIAFNHTMKLNNKVKPQPKIGKRCIQLTKNLYDQSNLNTSTVTIIPELITQNFDDEQVWQQLELNNNNIIPFLLEQISKTVVKKSIELVTGVTAARNETPDVPSEVNDSVSDSSLSSEEPSPKPALKKKKVKVTPNNSKATLEVEDKFFSLSQLEKFLNSEDAKEEKDKNENGSSSDDDSSNVDYFEDLPSDDDSDDEFDEEELVKGKHKKSAREAKYRDFFDPPLGDIDNTKQDSDGSEDSNDSNNEVSDMEYDTRDVEDEKGPSVEDLWASRQRDSIIAANDTGRESEKEAEKVIFKKPNEGKSTFQKQQEKLKQSISEIEEFNLSEKPWQLKGEVNAEGRPENSLLEEHLQFDHLSRQAPVITEETTKTLEEIILQRIKDKAWDDVERKVKPKEIPFEYKRRVILDQEKSKLSLAEIYEKEYIKQRQNEKEEKQVPEHNEIKKALTDLFSKLDALSNFHYMPKTPSSEIRIVNNLPAFTVEDVAPVNISDAGLLAPEEVQGKVRGELIGNTERSKTDCKRERRAKKLLQHKKYVAKEAKNSQLKPSLQTKQSKIEARKTKKGIPFEDQKKSVKSLNSSSAFFAKLQDKVHSEIQDHITKKKVTTAKKYQTFKL